MVRQHRAELGGGNRPSFVENPGYEHHFFEEVHVAIFPMRWSFSRAPQSPSMALRRFGPCRIEDFPEVFVTSLEK